MITLNTKSLELESNGESYDNVRLNDDKTSIIIFANSGPIYVNINELTLELKTLEIL